MNIVLTTNTGLRKVIRGLFTLKPTVRTVLKDTYSESAPLGICRTAFEHNTYEYHVPVKPEKAMTTEECVKEFGRRYSVNFKTLVLATNEFKS